LATPGRRLERVELVGVKLEARRKQALAHEIGQILNKACRPQRAEYFSGGRWKVAPTAGVRRDWFDKRLAVQPPVAVEHVASFRDERLVA
jgi:hypothetical protein